MAANPAAPIDPRFRALVDQSFGVFFQEIVAAETERDQAIADKNAAIAQSAAKDAQITQLQAQVNDLLKDRVIYQTQVNRNAQNTVELGQPFEAHVNATLGHQTVQQLEDQAVAKVLADGAAAAAAAAAALPNAAAAGGGV